MATNSRPDWSTTWRGWIRFVMEWIITEVEQDGNQ